MELPGPQRSFDDQFSRIPGGLSGLRGPRTSIGEFVALNLGCETRRVPEREVTVWIPPGVKLEDRKDLQVLIALDGQNVFDNGSPRPSLALTRRILELTATDEIEPVAVVAIPNLGHESRIFQFSGRKMEWYAAPMEDGGNLPNFVDWIKDGVITKVAAELSLSDNPKQWSIYGSSLAAAPVIQLAHDEFPMKNAFALSPGLWRQQKKSGEKVHSVFDAVQGNALSSDTKLFLGLGELEAHDRFSDATGMFKLTCKYLERLGEEPRALAKIFDSDQRHPNIQMRHHGDHSEQTWGVMMHEFLILGFGKA